MKWLHILRRWFQNGARLAAAALAFVCLLTCLQSGAMAAKTQAVSQGTDGAALMFNVYQNTDQVYEILDILSDKDVKATFFVGGIWAQQNPDALLAIEQAGHEIGNHGFNHKLPTKVGNEIAMEEIRRTEAVLMGILGHGSTLYAPPAGDYNQGTVDAAADMGMITVLWSADTIDWRDQDAALILSRAQEKMADTGFLLMHPTPATVEALADIIDTLRERGLRLTTVSDAL
jgi:peptidoglycan/xylan/chitin deacetylase (PgdA/CDA1 family)